MIAIGCDHGGIELKNEICAYLKENGVDFKDFGINDKTSVDYPDIAFPVAQSVVNGECEKAILVCGTGIGMSMAANKVKGIRAAVCSDHFSAKYTRLHNNANVLCLGGRVIGPGLAIELVDLFLNTEFEGGRHKTRIDKIAAIENNEF
ncbi:MAG: ribose 5-phosphate isomerase B [Clostridia bacterium]|nr:ribose 5-phosphate isomerase B [Clostridia bacterium]